MSKPKPFIHHGEEWFPYGKHAFSPVRGGWVWIVEPGALVNRCGVVIRL